LHVGRPLRGPDWIHISGELSEIARIVRSGVGRPVKYPIPMPMLGGTAFDDADVLAVAAYVHAFRRYTGR
jgi:hypothetical protein